jgi:hypothetical protein
MFFVYRQRADSLRVTLPRSFSPLICIDEPPKLDHNPVLKWILNLRQIVKLHRSLLGGKFAEALQAVGSVCSRRVVNIAVIDTGAD